MNIQLRREAWFLTAISLLFAGWAIAFIFRSSFIAIDGLRYFSLFDDAMISMRYAWNLANGNGLVWNAGFYIQGYTNLLMTLYMSLALSLFDKSNACLFIQLSGIVLVLISGYTASRMVGRLVAPDDTYIPYIRIAIFALTVSYYPLVYWSLMGMETGLLTALVMLGVFFSLRSVHDCSPRYLLISSFFFGLAFLTRNESIIISAITGLYILWDWPGNRDKRFFYFAAISIVIYSTIILSETITQYIYYGDYLPNTYTLKMIGMSALDRVKNGMGFIRPYLAETAILLLLPILDAVFHFKKVKIYILAVVSSMIAYQIYAGGDPWPYWRIMAPAMPLLFVLYAFSIKNIIETLSNSVIYKQYFCRNPIVLKRNCELFPSILILATIFFTNIRFANEITFISKPYTTASNEQNVNIALALNQVLGLGASIGVFWAGAIPFYSDAVAIDFLGKSDKHIANLAPDLSGKVSWSGMRSVPGHNKYDLHYSIEHLRPT